MLHRRNAERHAAEGWVEKRPTMRRFSTHPTPRRAGAVAARGPASFTGWATYAIFRPAGRGRSASALAAVVERHVVPIPPAGVPLPRTRDLLLLVVHHLEPLGGPARGARD